MNQLLKNKDFRVKIIYLKRIYSESFVIGAVRHRDLSIIIRLFNISCFSQLKLFKKKFHRDHTFIHECHGTVQNIFMFTHQERKFHCNLILFLSSKYRKKRSNRIIIQSIVIILIFFKKKGQYFDSTFHTKNLKN